MTKMRMKMNMSLTTATFEVTDLEMKATSEVGDLMEMETNATLMMKMRNAPPAPQAPSPTPDTPSG